MFKIRTLKRRPRVKGLEPIAKKPETPEIKANVVKVTKRVVTLSNEITPGSLKLRKNKKLQDDNEEAKTCTDSQKLDLNMSHISSVNIDNKAEESFVSNSLLNWSMSSTFYNNLNKIIFIESTI